MSTEATQGERRVATRGYCVKCPSGYVEVGTLGATPKDAWLKFSRQRDGLGWPGYTAVYVEVVEVSEQPTINEAARLELERLLRRLDEGQSEWSRNRAGDLSNFLSRAGQLLGVEPLPGWRVSEYEPEDNSKGPVIRVSGGWWVPSIGDVEDRPGPEQSVFATALAAMKAVEALAGEEPKP